MKKISIFTGLIVMTLFFMSTYFSSCVHDACVARNVQCQNNGVCRDGNCLCPSGYEGDSCQFKVNKKFAYNYKCIRTGFVDDTIPDDNDDTLVVRVNPDKFGITLFSIRDSVHYIIKATTNDNFVTIAPQDITFKADTVNIYNVNVSGSGSLAGDVLTLTVYNKWYDNTLQKDRHSKFTYAGTKYKAN